MITREQREAILLLTDLRKPVELIARQLDLTPEQVRKVIEQRDRGPVQLVLFE